MTSNSRPSETAVERAPDCARCHDTGRYSWTGVPRRDVTPELLHQMADLFNRHYVGAEQGAATRAGLGAVLEGVLAPVTTESYCRCKHGKRAAGTVGVPAPRSAEPDPAYALGQVMPVARALYCVWASRQLAQDAPFRAQRQARAEEEAQILLRTVAPAVRDALATSWRHDEWQYIQLAQGGDL